MVKLGIGGQLGAGKSELAKILQELFSTDGDRATIINADEIAWQLYTSNSPVYKKILKTFGERVLDTQHQIDRKKLAQIVFASRMQLRKLNQIVHPVLIKELNQRLNKSPGEIKILDAALLFMWNKKIPLDIRILVRAPDEQKISRMAQKGFSGEEIKNRLRLQMSEDKMEELADFVITNDSSYEVFKERAQRLYQILRTYLKDKLS